MSTDFRSIVAEVNSRACNHPIGTLQQIRKDLTGKKRLAVRSVFDRRTTTDLWAFHYGGRRELQFNLGIEGDELRYGVAFSLERTQTLPNVDLLLPNIKRFNDFIELYPELYADMKMWHYIRLNERSPDYRPTTIPAEIIQEQTFIFLGKRQYFNRIDYEDLLNSLDRLLPLYKYTEGRQSSQPIATVEVRPFVFTAGCANRSFSTNASIAAKTLDIKLRHAIIQKALYGRLVHQYGSDHVGTELASGSGTLIDVVVQEEDRFIFYEIKTMRSPRACLREALGQLLEYSFWPGSQAANRLVVVGETPLDTEGADYIKTLRQRFSLPLEYEHIVI